MKLKGRVLLGLLFVLGVITVFYSGTLLDELPSLLRSDDGYLMDQDGAMAGLRQLDRGSRGSEAAHIHFPRKDLDKSNYSSDNFSPEKEKLLFRPNAEEQFLKTGPDGRMQYKAHDGAPNLESINVRTTQIPQIQYFKPDIGTQIKLKSLENAVKRHLLSPSDVMEFEKDNLFPFTKWKTPRGPRLPLYDDYPRRNLTSWERFHLGIRKYALYNPDEGTVDDLLYDLVHRRITDAEEKSGGTQLKLRITFSNEGQALFKPQRFGREYETPPNHFYFVDFERHNAEIAAFHLDRVMGFYRVPPTAGRLANITRDFKRFADHKLAKTFFISPAKNQCFHGTCSYYCDTTHAVCGNPDMLEGSFASYLPPERLAPRKTWRNPWKRSYSKHRKATWEVYDNYCDEVRQDPLFKTGRRFLDIMDLSVFDFLIGNMDRHHYETLRDFGNNTFLLHLDHGRSFGKAKHDETSILAPVYQCCLIRRSTFMKFLGFYKGPLHLSDMMRKSMDNDAISPILLESHLEALDRRVSIILRTIATCLERGNPIAKVIVDDRF